MRQLLVEFKRKVDANKHWKYSDEHRYFALNQLYVINALIYESQKIFKDL